MKLLLILILTISCSDELPEESWWYGDGANYSDLSAVVNTDDSMPDEVVEEAEEECVPATGMITVATTPCQIVPVPATIKGEKGDSGADGADGAAGATGAAGARGAKGDRGATGATGASGGGGGGGGGGSNMAVPVVFGGTFSRAQYVQSCMNDGQWWGGVTTPTYSSKNYVTAAKKCIGSTFTIYILCDKTNQREGQGWSRSSLSTTCTGRTFTSGQCNCS